MKHSFIFKATGSILCLLLILAMALAMCGCVRLEPQAETISLEEGKTYGKGQTQFSLTVVHSDGKSITVTICTDKTIVGEALQELGILAGEEGPFGLYIKTVNGETLDYDTHKMYWSFYVGDSYAMIGVDQTAIEPGVSYAIKAEK